MKIISMSSFRHTGLKGSKHVTKAKYLSTSTDSSNMVIRCPPWLQTYNQWFLATSIKNAPLSVAKLDTMFLKVQRCMWQLYEKLLFSMC